MNVPSADGGAGPGSSSSTPGTKTPGGARGASVSGMSVPSADAGSGLGSFGTSLDDDDDDAPDTVSSTEPEGLEGSAAASHGWAGRSEADRAAARGHAANGPVKPAARRRPLALGLAAAMGLAVVGGGVAVMRYRAETASTGTTQTPASEGTPPAAAVPGTPPSSGTAAATAPGTRESPPSSGTAAAPSGATGAKADVPVPGPVPGSAPDAPGSGSAAVAASGDGSPDSDTSEVDGLKREETLGTEPRPAAGDSRPEASDAQDSRPAASTGTLQVRASPYATVFLNGKRLGEVSGRASYKLAPGTYKLHFEHPSGDKWFDVTIAAGASVTREFRASKAR